MPTIYEPSERVRRREEELDNLMKQRPGEFNGSAYDDAVNSALDKYLNREKFSYNLNADALYNQYKDQYMNQGKQAMMNTMGQASAMTGGYGNSYAQTVGQQTYQGYLQGLNDKVPDLYQLALDKYNNDSNEMLNDYALKKGQRDDAYSEYANNMNRWQNDVNLASNLLKQERDNDLTNFTTNYTLEKERAAEEQARLEAEKNKKIVPVQNSNTNMFEASIMTEKEFAKRKSTSEKYNNDYNTYVDAMLEKWTNDGKLTEEELAYLLTRYNLF